MKKYIFALLITFSISCFCGCAHQNNGTPTDAILNKEPTSAVIMEQKELAKFPVSSDAPMSLLPFPDTYEKLLDRIGEDGRIVAGRATGSRTSTPLIWTNFAVEKVYWGDSLPAEITVRENYGVYYDENNEPYILTLGYEYCPLINDQPTLLFIYPDPDDPKSGNFWTSLIPIPLPEDHQDYNETYLTEFLNFFRGDRSVYKYPQLSEKPLIIDGTAGTQKLGGTYWPTYTDSNKALLAKMDDHPLVQLAVNLKIKLWPYGHINFPSDRGFSEYFANLCYPPKT